MKAYKLVRQLKDGQISPLFINKKLRISFNEWLPAETTHNVKGFAYRPGWHCTSEKNAPHLSMKGRVWCEVEISDYEVINRPESQGGVWYLAKQIKFKSIINNTERL